jgi:AcrR family transcriptional regulator
MVPGNKAKNKIIEAAKIIVSEQGVQKATLRAIAAKAGISIGTLYYYYPSKNDLLYDIIDSHTSESYAIAESFKKDDSFEKIGRERLNDYLVAKIKERIYGVEDNLILFYLIQEAIMGNEDIKENIQKKYKLWIDSIDTIVTKVFKVSPSKTSRATAMIINAAIDGFMLYKLLGIEEEDISAELEEVGRLLLMGNFEEYAGKIKKGKGGN